MKTLALSDEILMSIEKPERYIGCEVNEIIKDPGSVDIRFAMCFPDIYEIGMSNLAVQILYDMFNKRPDVYCERVFSPWLDLHAVMKENDIPLFSLEMQDPIREFDFLGITLQYEMAYTNILQILDLSGIPFMAGERSKKDPIVIAGGPCVYNPEPIADFFDIVYIGEGEESYDALFDLYKECTSAGASREEYLRRAAEIPGIYVPSLYEIVYDGDGFIKERRKLCETAPDIVKRVVAADVSRIPYPEKPIVPFMQVTQDRVVLEIMRGCIRGCRFCQAGMIYRPTRQKSVETLKEQARVLLKNTGQDEISLSSLSSSDYEDLDKLISFLVDEIEGKGVNISLPSLRIDAFSLDVMSKVQDVKKSSLTFAPEAGSQRMRDVINKGLTEEDIINGATMAFEGGWNKVKLYFMLGLPEETDEDIEEIPHLANKIAMQYYDVVPKEKRQGKCQISISTSFFVPKPFTPFQWMRMYPPEEYLSKAHRVNDTMKSELNKKSLRYNWHQADETVLEGVLARGDRRIARLLVDVYKRGAIFDSWTESFSYQRWLDAFEDTGIKMDFYIYRERDLEETLPWDFLDIGVSKNFLKREYGNALAGRVTKNCREACSGCGAASFQTGVCV